MAQYRLEIVNRATKELSKIRPDIGLKLLASIESLSIAPKPRQSHKLHGSNYSYRLRVGDYRILYYIDETTKLITVYKIGHRREVYRE